MHLSSSCVGGRVDTEVRADLGTLTFQWFTKGSGELLMMSMPHHVQKQQNADHIQNLVFDTLFGEMIGTKGESWTLDFELPTTSWTAPRDIKLHWKSAIKDALLDEQEITAPVDNIYDFGKALSAIARLALIAEEIGEADKVNVLTSQIRTHLGNAPR